MCRSRVIKDWGPISHPVVKRWLLKPAFKHSLTSVYLSFSISHPVVKHWVMELYGIDVFVGDTSCCQNKANPVSHGIPPPMDFIPPDKISYDKSSPSMGFLPPPSQNRSHMLSQCCIWNLCWRRFAIVGEVLPWDFFRGRLAIWYYFPGEVLLWDFFRGKACYMVFLQGERLPYGIISAGTISHGICSLIMKFVWGGIYHRGETLPYGIVSPLEKFCHWISSGGRFAIWYAFRGDDCHMV